MCFWLLHCVQCASPLLELKVRLVIFSTGGYLLPVVVASVALAVVCALLSAILVCNVLPTGVINHIKPTNNNSSRLNSHLNLH